jgi:hypothetical protein
VVYFGLPSVPRRGQPQRSTRWPRPTLEQLKDAPFRRITPQPGEPGKPRARSPSKWADVLAGDIGAIRRYAPARSGARRGGQFSASEEDLTDLRQRGVSIAVWPDAPSLDGMKLGRWSAATVEAMLAAMRPDPTRR